MKKIILQEIQKNDLQGVELRGSLLAKNIKFKDTGLNSKTFHYWKMNGLISFVGEGKWAEISFIEYLWLKVLESMRGFGCSLKLMQKIYYDQFLKAYEEDLNRKTLIDNIAYYKSIRKMRELDEYEKERLILSEQTLNDPLINIALRTEISYFYQLVSRCLETGTEVGIIIYQDETYAMLGDESELINRDKPHIYIPLSHFIADLFVDEEKVDFINQLKLFSADEIRLVKELRANNVEKVTITYDSEVRRVKKIEYDKTGLINGDKAKEVMRILGMQNYSGFKLKTRTGTSLSYTRTETKNFK
jgi:hypothetical protein